MSEKHKNGGRAPRLIAAVASSQSNSYASFAEADAIVAKLDDLHVSEWWALTHAQKEYRLILSACVFDAKRHSGIKATKAQRLDFPRLHPGHPLYIVDETGNPMSLSTWETLEDYAALKGVTDLPSIPLDVKRAQVEAAFRLCSPIMPKQRREDMLL